jgi:6-phosphogluconolactonase (cycloisomerase 2 family)
MHLEKGQPRLKTAHWPLLPPGTSAKDVSIAELVSHPDHPETFYISFRGQVAASNGAVKGDKIGIIQLGSQSDFVQDVKHLDTGLDFIRGMSISDDAKYLAATGQNAGGIEVYEISGLCGEILTLKAKLDVQGTEQGTSLAWV